MESDILELAKAADIDLMASTDWGQLRNLFRELIAEVERLRSTLVNLKAHNYVNAFPDGGYAMRILQSYREMCDQYVSDDITGGPTNPVYIAMNEANEKRKIELDKAISDLAGIAAKDDRIAQDAITIQMHYENVLTLQKEVERLRSAPKSGLYGKYIIQKADGSTVDPKADYFILRLDTDPYARIAALEYAIQTDDQNLGKQLEARVFDHVFSPDDQCRARADAWPLGMIKRMEAEVAAKDARIKELESEITAWVADRDSWIGRYEAVRKEKDARIADQEAYIERLEAAFLDSLAARLYYEHYPGVSDAYSLHDYPEDACHCMPKEKFREKAREALERIKAETGSGDHVAGANKLILTAEQREALEHVIEYVQETQMPISNLNEFDMQELRSLLTGSKPAWEVTEERIAAMKDACNFLVYAEIRNKGVNSGNVDRAKNAEDVLRAMLAGGKRDA